MTYDKLKKAECLREEIHEANNNLRYIKHYEHQLFSYGMEVVIPQCGGVNNEMYFYDKQLKKDILNTIKIHLIQKIQNAEKELESL
jgi:hypothetical protein